MMPTITTYRVTAGALERDFVALDSAKAYAKHRTTTGLERDVVIIERCQMIYWSEDHQLSWKPDPDDGRPVAVLPDGTVYSVELTDDDRFQATVWSPDGDRTDLGEPETSLANAWFRCRDAYRASIIDGLEERS